MSLAGSNRGITCAQKSKQWVRVHKSKNEEEDVIAGSNREVDRRLTDRRVHESHHGVKTG